MKIRLLKIKHFNKFIVEKYWNAFINVNFIIIIKEIVIVYKKLKKLVYVDDKQKNSNVQINQNFDVYLYVIKKWTVLFIFVIKYVVDQISIHVIMIVINY